MCYFEMDEAYQRVLLDELSKLTRLNKQFTGYDVWCSVRGVIGAIYKDKCARSSIVPNPPGRREISTSIRELFNEGRPPMLGYGCMKVGDPDSPVLYYRPPKSAREKARGIQEAISVKEERQEEKVLRDQKEAEKGGESEAA